MAINGKEEKILHKKHLPSKNNNRSNNNSGVLIIDPNKVEYDGKIKDRYVNQEDLIIYASLKIYKRANRSVIYNTDDNVIGDKDITNEAIYINLLNPIKKKGSDGSVINKNKLTSEWTNFFTDDSVNDKDSDGYILDPEAFGITNISIKINANYHPVVTIQFTDVQGRTLFERGNDKDNPYNIFFTYPYPNFSLKYKGYYGKAVETPLVLIRSNTSFDPSTGNYNITAEFQSEIFSLLNTFLTVYAYVAPYMFKLDNGEYLGKIILKQLYDRQNKKIRETVGDLEFEKYNIENVPTLYDLSKAITDISLPTGVEKTGSFDATENNNILLLNKQTIESYNNVIKDFFLGSDFTPEIQNSSVIYTYKTGDLSNNQEFKSLLETFNEAVNNLNQLKLKPEINNTFKELPSLLNKNINLNKKITINELLTVDLFKKEGSKYHLSNYDIVLNKLFLEIDKLQSTIEDDYVYDQIKDLSYKLGYQPNLSNVLRIIANNMQTFLIMLDMIGKSAIKQLKNDSIRLDNQKNNSDYNKDFQLSIHSAFPNYFRTKKDFINGEFLDITHLSYPGSIPINNNWFEVRFVEEIYEAFNRINPLPNNSKGIGGQNPTAILTVFQLGELDLENYKFKELSEILGELYSKYALYISYSGLLYRGLESENKDNIISDIVEYEFNLIDENILSKIKKDNRFVLLKQISNATKDLTENNIDYTNLGNFGLKFIGFSDGTPSGSVKELNDIFKDLIRYATLTYTEDEYKEALKKLNNLKVKNKQLYEIITYKKSGNDINLYSNTSDKKNQPLKHLIDLSYNDDYYFDNEVTFDTFNNDITKIKEDNNNPYQGLYIDINTVLSKINVNGSLALEVEYNNEEVPALTFNTPVDSYKENEYKPFSFKEKSETNNLHIEYNI